MPESVSADPELVTALRAQVPDPELRTLLLATALVESGGQLDRTGDGGASEGPFQEHERGRGTGLSVAERRDPWGSVRRAMDEFVLFRRDDPGEWAAAAQRPKDRVGYATKIRARLDEAALILAVADEEGVVHGRSPTLEDRARGAASAVADAATAVPRFLGLLADRDLWIRVGFGAGGLVALVVGLLILARAAGAELALPGRGGGD